MNLQTDAPTGPPPGTPNTADQRTYWLINVMHHLNGSMQIDICSKETIGKSIQLLLGLISEETGSGNCHLVQIAGIKT